MMASPMKMPAHSAHQRHEVRFSLTVVIFFIFVSLLLVYKMYMF